MYTGKGGRPKNGGAIETAPGTVSISTHTAAVYKKVASNLPSLDSYVAAIEAYNAAQPPDSPEILEISTAGFLRYVGLRRRLDALFARRDDPAYKRAFDRLLAACQEGEGP